MDERYNDPEGRQTVLVEGDASSLATAARGGDIR